MSVNIIIAGVGGQGNILASRIIGEAALIKGYEVRISETHGMAQRGGSVHSMIRFGSVVSSPLVPKGCCNYLLSLEVIEGLRWIEYLSQNPVIIVSTEIRPPYVVSIGKTAYPDNIEEIYSRYGTLITIPASEMAVEAGSVKAANMVLIGAFAYFEKKISLDDYYEAIEKRFKGKKEILEVNIKAFDMGYRYSEKFMQGR